MAAPAVTYPVTPADIASGIEAAWASHLARQSRGHTPHDYIYASAFRPCDRRMAYELTVPDQQPPFSPETLAKFRRGDDRERDLLADLTRIGRDADPAFRVTAQQERFTLRDHQSRVAIVGKVDARLEVGGARAPLEVKSWSPFLTDRIECFEDLFENPWTRSGGHQLLAYLLAAAEPYGFLLLDRSGLPRLLPVELAPNLDRIEAFLTKAERVLDHVQAGTLPDYIDDPAECKRCGFYGGTCNPPLVHQSSVILNDPELELALDQREALKDAAKEYDRIDGQIKKQLRGVIDGVVGRYIVKGKWGRTTKIDVPPEIRKQFTTTDERGRFTLEITRVS
jgi:hypothetical protein